MSGDGAVVTGRADAIAVFDDRLQSGLPGTSVTATAQCPTRRARQVSDDGEQVSDGVK